MKKIYMAPMEGLTGYVFRNTYEKYYGKGNIDKYFIPFISPNKTGGYTSREREDIDPVNNVGMYVVPQIMANDYMYFLRGARLLLELGYKEINLNMGCPSGTVVSKFRGAGFLAKPDELDQFLDKIFKDKELQHIHISIKTRIGITSAEEFDYLLTIYNQYPLKELIIHPRVQKDYYNNYPNLEAFSEAMEKSVNPLCYNGDIFTLENLKVLEQRFPQLEKIMIGRGLVGAPFMIDQIRQNAEQEKLDKKRKENNSIEDDVNQNVIQQNSDNTSKNFSSQTDKQEIKRLQSFLNELLAGYIETLKSETNACHKMKEVWKYLKTSFDVKEREFLNIKKANHLDEYKVAVDSFFRNAVLRKL